MTVYDECSPRLTTAAKWLHEDGSVTGAGGSLLLPADEARAADFATRSPHVAKWLLADGTVTSKFPGGSGGGSDGSGKPPAAIEIYLPIRATDALGAAALVGDYSVTGWRIDVAGAPTIPRITDSAVATITQEDFT
jgi:hypothetical protein